MTSLNKSINRRVGSLFAVAALLLATVTPGLVPAFASAAQVTERSVQLSSSSKTASNVSYTVNFTSVGAAGAFVVEFCEDTPLIGSACTAPAGLTVAAVDTEAVGWTVAETTYSLANDRNSFAATGTIGATAPISVQFDGITNPTDAGTVYARVVTYDTGVNALAYESEDLGSGSIDDGGAAFSITDTIGVSGAVLESMTFCVSGTAIDTANCGGSLTAPTVKLGEGTGDILALSSEDVSTGSIYSQLSTNAASGAVVNLKSSTIGCGGLIRVGPANCDIVAANGAGGIAANQARFGAQVASAADPVNGSPVSQGTYRAAGDSPYYSSSVFKLNYVSGDLTGITSPFGDPILDTDDAPVSDKNVQITFGASVSNQTPAGLYSADLSLIATGKF